jgi:TonB-linked SusC/RagA family outer membrane protein
MNRKKLIFLFALQLMFCHQLVFSQVMNISGKVIDEADKQAIPGVAVSIKGTSKGTTTNTEGKYNINANKGDFIVFSFMGMETVGLVVGSNHVVNIQMKTMATEIDEIVVVGYSAVKKSDLTGSVQTVKKEELMKSAPISLEQGIQGRLAGVNVIKNDGAPGGGISVQIRGTNSFMGSTEPLYVIDGVPMSVSNDAETVSFDNNEVTYRNALSFLDPNDIESLEVLKDASATAIYGSRGSNGVVMITTKNGRKGKDKITFGLSTSFSQVANKIRLLTGAEYAEYRNQSYINTQLITNGTFNPQGLPFLGAIGSLGTYVNGPTDFDNDPYYWQDAIFRTAISKNYNVGFSGAADGNDYSIGLSYLDQKGTVVNSGYSRFSLNLKLNRQLNKWLKFGNTINLSVSNSDMIKSATSNQNNGDEGVVRSALYFPSIYRLEDNVGYEDFQIVTNPIDYANSLNKNRNYNLYSSNYLNVNILKGLIFRTVFSYRASINFANRYFSKRLYEGRTVGGTSLTGDTQNQTYVWDNLLMFNRTFGEHNVSATMGTSWESTDYYKKQVSTNGFGSDSNNGWIMNEGTSPQTPYSVKQESVLFSLITRAAYTYRNTYFLTGTFRRDASSKFAENNKTAYFPSIGVAWKMTGENFLKNSRIVNNLKLRYSYGTSGNAGIGPYGSLPLFMGANYPIGTNVISGYASDPSKPGNPDLKWETTYQNDIGFEATFFKNLNFEMDYYLKTTKDLIQNMELAPSTGFNSVYANIGEVVNKGFELTLNYNLINSKNIQLSIGGNLSLNNNVVTSLGTGSKKIFQNNLWNDLRPFVISEGRPIGQLFGYIEEGIWNSRSEIIESPLFQTVYPEYTVNTKNAATEKIIKERWIGEVKIKDSDGNGSITENDQDYIGNVNPDFLYAFNLNFSWKNLEFSFLFNGVQGNDIINMANLRYYNLGQTRNVPKSVLDNAWRPESGGSNPKIFTTNARDIYFTKRYLEDGSYLKLRNVSIGYSFKKPFKFIELIRIFASGNNLLTFTSYTGYDPEVNAFGSNPSSRGVDAGGYPQSREFNFGINVSL